MRGVCYGPLLLAGLASAAPAIALGGTLLSTVGAIQAGNAQKAASNYQAAQLEAAGNTERASAQRQAVEEKRQSDITLSRARLVGAASGGGQDIHLLGQIEEDGALRAATAMWEGEEAAKGRKAQANAARFEGSQYQSAGYLKGASTLLSGGSSFLENYG